jgi:hypothetical protein
MKAMKHQFSVAFLGVALLTACGPDARDHEITAPLTAHSQPSGESNYSSWSAPMSLGPTINTPFADQQATLSKDGLSLYFASTRPEAPNDAVLDNNIYVARRTCVDCPWGPPVSLGAAINTTSNDANPNLSRDQHWLFFASNRVAGGARGGTDLWVSYREHVQDDFGWLPPMNLGPQVNTSVNENAPAYFENGDLGIPQLFFNRQAGSAGLGDIYVSELTAAGTWGAASPVEELNGPAADQRPSISHDGLEIYFWSGRDAGRGDPGDGYIWHAIRGRVTEAWSPPTLVDDPVNEQSAVQPFIHSHGRTETLFLVRNLGTVVSPNLDLFMSTRTRGGK